MGKCPNHQDQVEDDELSDPTILEDPLNHPALKDAVRHDNYQETVEEQKTAVPELDESKLKTDLDSVVFGSFTDSNTQTSEQIKILSNHLLE